MRLLFALLVLCALVAGAASFVTTTAAPRVTVAPTTSAPSTQAPTTEAPSTEAPTFPVSTTPPPADPKGPGASTPVPTEPVPTTAAPEPSTVAPETTPAPTTTTSTAAPTTAAPTPIATTPAPTTTTPAPTTTTPAPTTTTPAPTTTTAAPTTQKPTTVPPTTLAPGPTTPFPTATTPIPTSDPRPTCRRPSDCSNNCFKTRTCENGVCTGEPCAVDITVLSKLCIRPFTFVQNRITKCDPSYLYCVSPVNLFLEYFENLFWARNCKRKVLDIEVDVVAVGGQQPQYVKLGRDGKGRKMLCMQAVPRELFNLTLAVTTECSSQPILFTVFARVGSIDDDYRGDDRGDRYLNCHSRGCRAEYTSEAEAALALGGGDLSQADSQMSTVAIGVGAAGAFALVALAAVGIRRRRRRQAAAAAAAASQSAAVERSASGVSFTDPESPEEDSEHLSRVMALYKGVLEGTPDDTASTAH